VTPHLRRWGDGRSFLIHCALAHGGVLAGLAKALPGGAVAMDLPGHGSSPAWRQDVDYQAQTVSWAAAAMARPGPVFGHSFGATAALRLAVEHPHLVTHLSLAEPVFFAALRLHDPQAYVAHVENFAPVTAAFEAGDMARAAEVFTDLWGGTPWGDLPGRFRSQLVSLMPLVAAQHAGIDEDSGDVFAPGRLEALECPVVLIRGTDTQPSVRAIHRVLLERLPNAAEHVLGGAGHMAPVSHPQDVARLSLP